MAAWVLLAAPAAGGELSVRLEVAPTGDGAEAPYARAVLHVGNAGAAGIERVRLRPSAGGPAVEQALTVPPGQEAAADVPLPAISPVQRYEVTALSAAGEAVGTAGAEITWPADRVAADAFLDDSYDVWRDAGAGWPARTRRTAVLVVALFVLAAAGLLFIRRAPVRLGAVVVLAAGAAGLIGRVVLPAAGAALRAHRYRLVRFDGAGGVRGDSFAVLSARRTTTVRRRTATLPYPVYPDRQAAADDGAVVIPAERAIRLTLRPGRVRIIRPAWWEHPRATAVPRRGRARRGPDGLTVETDGFTRRALLIADDRVWPLAPLAGRARFTVPTDRAELIWAFLAGPGGRDWDDRSRRLLDYWRVRHQRAGEVYLIEPAGAGVEDVTSMQVVRLVGAAAPASAPASAPAASRQAADD